MESAAPVSPRDRRPPSRPSRARCTPPARSCTPSDPASVGVNAVPLGGAAPPDPAGGVAGPVFDAVRRRA